MDYYVCALMVSGTNLYAGGDFTRAGEVTANCIAKWDGHVWSALGSGMNNTVFALAVSGTNLYAGGAFDTAGGVPVNYIAKWDGQAWSALGEGLGPLGYYGVAALAVSGTDLYAGGQFTTAGGVPANYIAKWDGQAWSALGEGVDWIVYALALNGTDLYAGGNFTAAGGLPANGIAKWDGSVWSPLSSGMAGPVPYYGEVSALAVSGTNLYAGGYFTNAGGVTANYVAKWDGNAWSALGSGVRGSPYPHVNTLAADGLGHLFVGGYFSLAGTNVSRFIAQANIGLAVAGGQFETVAYSPLTGFSCTFSDGTIGQTYRIQTCPSLGGSNWSDLTNFTYTGQVVISDPSALAVPMKFYRAVSP
jgi:hypothetical protein